MKDSLVSHIEQAYARRGFIVSARIRGRPVAKVCGALVVLAFGAESPFAKQLIRLWERVFVEVKVVSCAEWESETRCTIH